MSFTKDDITKLANLARLTTSGTSIVEDLSNILQLLNKINAIDTNNITPMAHAQEQEQRLRPDIVTEPDARAAMQRNVADRVKASLYVVPKVIE